MPVSLKTARQSTPFCCDCFIVPYYFFPNTCHLSNSMVSSQGCVWFDIQCLGMTGYAEPVMLKQRSNCNHAMKEWKRRAWYVQGTWVPESRTESKISSTWLWVVGSSDILGYHLQFEWNWEWYKEETTRLSSALFSRARRLRLFWYCLRSADVWLKRTANLAMNATFSLTIRLTLTSEIREDLLIHLLLRNQNSRGNRHLQC